MINDPGACENTLVSTENARLAWQLEYQSMCKTDL